MTYLENTDFDEVTCDPETRKVSFVIHNQHAHSIACLHSGILSSDGTKITGTWNRTDEELDSLPGSFEAIRLTPFPPQDKVNPTDN